MSSSERLPAAEVRQYQQILDSIEHLVLLKGPGSRILWANRAFRDFYGMSNADLKNMIDASFNDPDYTKQYVLDDKKVFETGQLLDIPSEPIIGASGETRYFHTVKTPIVDDDGRVLMTVGVSNDITEELRKTEILAVQKEKMTLASKLASLGEMASGIAHEINNPLCLIQVLSGQLRELLAEGVNDVDRLMQFASDIEETTKRIHKIIESLKGFSRDDSSDAMERVPLRAIVEQTMSLCGERFRHHDTRVEVLVPESGFEVLCHPSQISQVVLNLLNNAHDAIEQTENRWIRIDAVEDEDSYLLRIEDSGPEIPPEVVEKMMNPFFTTKTIGKGTGLGLSISRGLLERHFGELEFDSEHSHTRFIIRLPRPRATD